MAGGLPARYVGEKCFKEVVMKYKCIILDHDDTVVDSTRTIHQPCLNAFFKKYYPDKSCSLENYVEKTFEPGFVKMCEEEFGIDEEGMQLELEFWKDYVEKNIPKSFDGIKELLADYKKEGGIVAVVSHSYKDTILRDYFENNLPSPDAIYGWERPDSEKKPHPYPVFDIIKRFSLKKEDVLVVDDLKTGYDMAVAAGVDFAAAGWANDNQTIQAFMQKNSTYYFKSVDAFSRFIKK